MRDIIQDSVVSSRIRLARNVKGLNFPHKLDMEVAFALMKRVSDVLSQNEKFNMYLMGQMSEIQKRAFVEKHLISMDLIQNDRIGAVLVNSDESISIMLNEEDHIREQCLAKGFDFLGAFNKLKAVDEKIIAEIPIAYDDRLGFLTSCPTNLGTGLRASVMIFLPALTKTGKISALIETLDKMKMTVRGIYGEGSESSGYLYQISNRVTLGYSEEDILASVGKAVLRICELESKEREFLFKNNSVQWTDKVMRAKGILTNAYVLSTNEFIEKFADVKIGVALGILECKDVNKLNNILTDILPANLTILNGASMNETERDLFRASYTKNEMNKIF